MRKHLLAPTPVSGTECECEEMLSHLKMYFSKLQAAFVQINLRHGRVGRGGSAKVRIPGEADPEQEEGVRQAGPEVRRLLGANLLFWGSCHL